MCQALPPFRFGGSRRQICHNTKGIRRSGGEKLVDKPLVEEQLNQKLLVVGLLIAELIVFQLLVVGKLFTELVVELLVPMLLQE